MIPQLNHEIDYHGRVKMEGLFAKHREAKEWKLKLQKKLPGYIVMFVVEISPGETE